MAPGEQLWRHEITAALIVPHRFTKSLIPLNLKAKLNSTRDAEVSVFLISPHKKLKQRAWDQHSIAHKILANWFCNNARRETTNCPSFLASLKPNKPNSWSFTPASFIEIRLETVLVPSLHYSHFWPLKRKTQTLNKIPTNFCSLFKFDR